METEEITISVDSNTAKAYKTSPSETQTKIGLLFGVWMKSVPQRTKTEAVQSLLETMDTIGKESQEKGMTPEVLEEILGKPVKHMF